MVGAEPVRYLLDSSFLIDYLRGNQAAISRFREMFENGDQILVNAIAVCEVATGSRPGEEGDLMAMLEPLEFVQPGPETALQAGRWRDVARRAGSTLSLPDALIAAAADAMDAIVVTRNLRDFALTPARVEAY